MKKIIAVIVIFFLLQTISNASNKNNILQRLEQINNISFSFIQTINGKDEKGNCVIQYPKKIFCKYEERIKKILVSNGSSLVIKKGKQYFRYSIESTPFEYLLDKNFLIKNIQSKKVGEINNKYLFFEIKENNNNINVYFSKKSYELVGWQIEDIYQNLAVTYIFDTAINKNIDEKLFKLPKKD